MRIFFNFWLLLRSWATVLKLFGAQQRKSKWCKAFSSVVLPQVAQRAKIQGLTKHIIFEFHFNFWWRVSWGSSGDTFWLKVMIISFKIQVSKLQVNSKTGRTKWEMMFYKGPPDSRFSWFSGFSCGLDRHFWSISARSSAKANGAKHSPPSFSLRRPKGLKFRIWRNTWYWYFLAFSRTFDR